MSTEESSCRASEEVVPLALQDVPAQEWPSRLRGLRPEFLARLTIAAVRTLVPTWEQAHPEDRLPTRALKAAEAALRSPNQDTRAAVRAFAKACTVARRRTLGYEHQIAEALRAILLATAEPPGSEAMFRELGEALRAAEDHRLYEHCIEARYGLEREVRLAFLNAMNQEACSSAEQ